GARGVILPVDRAMHLALVDDSSVQAAHALGSSATYVAGVAKLDGGLVLIHDLATFLSAAEAASLAATLRAAQASGGARSSWRWSRNGRAWCSPPTGAGKRRPASRAP